MWHILFILLLLFAILLIVFSIEYADNPFWNLIFITMSVPLWFILGLSNMQIEIPYEIYNVSSEQIETGYHTFTSPVSPYLTYFFVGIGLVMMIYLVAMLYDKWINYKP